MKKECNILGTGLLALDIVLNGSRQTPPKIQAGGSCGNVLTILSFLGCNSYPVSRLADNQFTDLLLKDLKRWNVNPDLLSKDERGSTPIIIHRIKKDRTGKPIHRFEFKNPLNGNWLPRFKPVLASSVSHVLDLSPENFNVFYFDRISRSSIDLAKYAKAKGAMVFFEPSSYKDPKLFAECLAVTDILKFSSDRIRDFKEVFPNRKVALEIETVGAKGINYRYNQDDWIHLNPYKLESVLDTAGAGDWCAAGIIWSILNVGGMSKLNGDLVGDAINFGQALGGLNCHFDGARGMMYAYDLDAVLELSKNLQVQNDSKFVFPHSEDKEIEENLTVDELDDLLVLL